MRHLPTILLLASALGVRAAGIELQFPEKPEPGVVKWDGAERRLSAAMQEMPLQEAMAKLAGATGWKVFLDPEADRRVTANFTNRPSGDGLRLMLGGLSFAVVPQSGGPSKLFVFRNAMSDATLEVQAAPEKKRGKDWLSNEVIVTLRKNSTRNIDELARLLGAKIVGRDDALRTYRLKFESDEAAERARGGLSSSTDLRMDDNYALRSPDVAGQGGSLTPRFNLKPSSDPSQTVVAVIDTAVQFLDADKSKFVLPTTDISGPADPAKLASNVPMHGTSMVSEILNSLANEADAEEFSNVRIKPYNVYGAGEATSTYEVTLGVYRAVSEGADIVNLSLGGEGDSELLDHLIGQARNNGVLFFAAAGNVPTTAPMYPAANPLVYAVTAADRNGAVAGYANRGSFVDLIAPGTTFQDFGGQTFRVTGTSPATATVSGVAAANLSRGLPLPQVEQLVREAFGIKR